MDHPSPIRRVTLSPTLKEIYEADKVGFDSYVRDAELNALSVENDRVDGLESLYGYLLNDQPREVNRVSGNESFIGWVKSSAERLVQTVRDFFKWLWSFFGAKQMRNETSMRDAKESVATHGVKDGELAYPLTAGLVYPNPGRVSRDLNWVTEAITNLDSSLDILTRYAASVRTFCDATKTAPEKDLSAYLTGKVQAMQTSLETLVKPDAEGKVFFIKKKGLSLDVGKGRFLPNLSPAEQPLMKGAVFITNTAQVTKLLQSLDVVLDKADVKFKTVHELEDRMVAGVRTVFARAEKASGEREGASLARAGFNNAMANLGLLETTFSNAVTALLRLLKTSIKKG